MKRHLFAISAAAIFSAAFLIPSAASAAPCYSSTPASVGYSDSPSDSELGLAPELTGGSASLDGACNLTTGYSVLGQSAPYFGEFYSWFIDVDGNPATGAFGGAEMAMSLDATYGGALAVYSGGTWNALKAIPTAGPFAVRAALGDLGANSPTTLRFYGGGMWSGVYDDYFDFAPDPGQPSVPLAVSFATSPPAPAQPPVSNQSNCTVPKLKGLSYRAARARLSAAGCRVGVVIKRKSRRYNKRVISSDPRAGTVLTRGSSVDLVIGKKPAKRRSRGSSTTVRPASAENTALATAERRLNALTEAGRP